MRGVRKLTIQFSLGKHSKQVAKGAMLLNSAVGSGLLETMTIVRTPCLKHIGEKSAGVSWPSD